MACPAGKKAIGGGVRPTAFVYNQGPFVVQSNPTADNAGWVVESTFLGSTTSWGLTVYVVCAVVKT